MSDENEAMEQQTTTEASDPKRRMNRIKPMRAIPSERIGFDSHLAVIHTAAQASRGGVEPVSAERIEQSPGVRAQAASLNMGFLTDFGLFTKEGRSTYRMQEAAVKFAGLRNLDENRAKPILRPLVERSWWGTVTKNLLQFTPVLQEDALVKELMIESGVFDPKKERAARVLVEWMEYVGFVKRREGQVELAAFAGVPSADPAPAGQGATSQPQTEGTQTGPVGGPLPSAIKPPAPVPQAPAGESGASPVPAAPAEWVTLAWPNAFRVQVNPTPKAIKVLKAAIAQLEAAVAAGVEQDKSQTEV